MKSNFSIGSQDVTPETIAQRRFGSVKGSTLRVGDSPLNGHQLHAIP